MRQTEFSVILHFYPPNDPENQNFETIKKCLEILSFYIHMCTINEDHMICFIYLLIYLFIYLFILSLMFTNTAYSKK